MYKLGTNLEISCCFLHEETGLMPRHWSHQRRAATLCVSKGSSRAAPRNISLHEFNSDWLRDRGNRRSAVNVHYLYVRCSPQQIFGIKRAIDLVLSPCVSLMYVRYFYIRFIRIHGTTNKRAQFKLIHLMYRFQWKSTKRWLKIVLRK